MPRSKVKAKDHEKLDSAHIERAIQILEDGGTKKAACELLNISYNTSRLNKIIESHNSRKEHELRRRKELRGKPFDAQEIRYTILNYLKGDSISSLAKAQFRSINGVKKVLKEHGIPERDSTNNYWNPTIIPEDSISEDFEKGELVWSARYNCVSEVEYVGQVHKEHGNVYSIWVFGNHNEGAYQPWYELGKLSILKELGVSKDDFEDYNTGGLFYSIR